MLGERDSPSRSGGMVAAATVDKETGATDATGCKVNAVLGERVPSGRRGSKIAAAMAGADTGGENRNKV